MSQSPQPLSVGVWLSVKKWVEMKNAGLFDPESIMKAPELLTDFSLDANNQNSADSFCPINYSQLDTEGSSVLSQQQVVEGQKTVEKAELGHFEVLLHKNSEIMANSIYFQIPSSLAEYSTLLKSIEDQNEVLKRNGKKMVLVDQFEDVERTLDRCEIYNLMMQFVPVGEGPTAYDAVLPENRDLIQTPLKISLPPSVLLFQPVRTEVQNHQKVPSNRPIFTLSTVSAQHSVYKQLPLRPENALGPEGVAQYPLFFTPDGDGQGFDHKHENQENEHNRAQTLKPSIVCLKSPLSSGSSISHAMLLTHNAVSSNSIRNLPVPTCGNGNGNGNGNQNQNEKENETGSLFQPPSSLYTLPPGLHLLTHVSPHHKVYKVYVVGDVVEIECRDSIDLSGVYKQQLLSFQTAQFKRLCNYATDLFRDHERPHQNQKLVKEFRDFAAKLQDEYMEFCQNQSTQDQDGQNGTSSLSPPEPVSLYFNSQYMKMHIYTGSSPDDLLHLEKEKEKKSGKARDAPIEDYLHQVLDGSVQPLLSIFPNPLTRNDDIPSLVFSKDQLYPPLEHLYNNNSGKDQNGQKSSIPVKETIHLSQRLVIPPYIPSSETYEHARSESVVTSSAAWAKHVAIRKMLKSLWKTEQKDDQKDHSEKDQSNATRPRLGLPNLLDDTNQATNDFKTTIRVMARLLQDRLGLSLFGFDVVQNYYTGGLSVIDVNYFPTYSSVTNLPTRVALEVLKKHRRETKGGN